MIKDFLNSAAQKKFFLMFFTAVIYIIGLIAYFNNSGILIASLIMFLGIFAILKNYLSPKLVIFWYIIFFFAFFNASLRTKDSDQLYQISPQNAQIFGQVVSIPTSGDKNKIKFFFNVSKISYNGKFEKIKAKTYVTAFTKNNDFSKFNIGNFYTIKGKLRAPFKVTNPSQFNYGKYLRNFGVYSVFYANEDESKIQVTNLSIKWKFLQSLNNIRNNIIQTHAKYLKSPNLEILGGIVFGDDAIAPPDYIKTSFINSGLLHLLAASGMNVALIYGIWFYILRKLRVPFNLTVLSGIFVVIFYSLMTGLGPSVIRAACMLIFILVGKLIDRDAHSISLLSFVALLMLIYNPAYINDVGFELSFVVTFGLLVMGPPIFERIASASKTIESKNELVNKILNSIYPWLSGAIFVPLIAQIWIAPIQMYYFNSFSLYSIFANILIVPFVTIVSFGGFISAVLALIKPLAGLVCFCFDFVLNPILNIIVIISEYFSHLPHALIQMPEPSAVQLLLYYSIIFLITLLIKIGRNKKIITIISILFCALVISCINLPKHDLETIAFDVQNADAFLIKTPNNKYFLIDSGKMSYNGGKTQAQMIVLQYLKDNGIKNIEGFVITHFDSDHAGGACDLIQNLNIKNVYINSLNDKSRLAKKIYKCTKKKRNLRLAKNNEVIYKEGNLTIKNFVANLNGEKLENENSIVTLVSYKDFDELFMGDAGITAFEKFKKYLPLKVEILKVGHHGAKNVINKQFLDKINPDVAIISTGLNTYGHPNGVTLDILQRHKVKTLRTDRQNAIKIDMQNNSKKNSYQIYSYSNLGWVKIH